MFVPSLSWQNVRLMASQKYRFYSPSPNAPIQSIIGMPVDKVRVVHDMKRTSPKLAAKFQAGGSNFLFSTTCVRAFAKDCSARWTMNLTTWTCRKRSFFVEFSYVCPEPVSAT